MEITAASRRVGIVLMLVCACGGGGDQARGGRLPATDSAASATAMATGRKTASGRISWEADSSAGPIRNLGETLDAVGWSVGLVSTVPFSHATPACFAAHSPNRDDTHRIADDLVRSGVADLLIGAGNPRRDNPDRLEDAGYVSRQTYADLVAGIPGVVFVERTRDVRADSLLASAVAGLDPDDGWRVVGLFGGPDGCMEPAVITGSADPPCARATLENPSLASAAVAALDFLARDDEGFFLLLEQGDIDWANHDNDFAWLMGAMWQLEEAVAAVAAYVDTSAALDWDDTMVILTADHGCGCLRIGPPPGILRGILPAQVSDSSGWTYPDGEVEFMTGTHTGELVSFRAALPARVRPLADSLLGSPPAPGPGMLDNTHVFVLVTGAAAMEDPVRHVILLIGDGMGPSCEAAAGAFLHGAADGMLWDDPGLFPFSAWCTTWDVDAYDQRAAAAGAARFDPERFDPRIGYDPALGGAGPSDACSPYFLDPLPLPERGSDPGTVRD